ncbi:MAG TPA: phage/plasmid primase, P4 family [Bacteroidia bacterium]|jgi:putative DNA primase/helicase|nr:phage/plasmid primase, P4 family [Bacteroidia bacterium]
METYQLPLQESKTDEESGKLIKLSRQPNHDDILRRLLSEIKPIEFRDILGLPAEEKIETRHVIVAVVKYLLQIANDKNWGLCQKYDYTYIYNGAYWKQYTRSDIRKFLCDAAIKMGHPDYEACHFSFSENLLKQFISYAHLAKPEVQNDKMLINLQNYTFEFGDSGWIPRTFNPADFLTYQLPFDYNSTAKCPIFDKYLLKVLPDESSRMVLQEFAGFIFSKLNLEKCLVLTGNGGNGKSVFFNILNALVGKDNTLNYSLGLFGREYNRAKLTNVLLNYSSERGFDLHPDTFKTLVSGEPIQAREPYGRSFTICSPVKFIINCNELPKETENTEAYFRRFLIIPFAIKISQEEKDIYLADKIIRSELPGVFNWALEGLNRIVKQKQFTYCESSEKAMVEFRKQADSPQLFIEEYSYQPSDEIRVTLMDLYSEYKDYCKDNKYLPLGKNRFSQRLETKGFEKIRRNDGTYFCIAKVKV